LKKRLSAGMILEIERFGSSNPRSCAVR